MKEKWTGERCDRRKSCDCRRTGRNQPAREKKQNQTDWDQAAPQVVEYFPARQGIQWILVWTARCWNTRKKPGEYLPVAANPPMLTSCFDIDPRRVFVEQLDVGDRADTGETPLDQIVAQNMIGRKRVLRCGGKRVDVVNAFAGITAFAEQILVNVRNGSAVRVKSAAVGIDPREPRPVCACQAYTHARL